VSGHRNPAGTTTMSDYLWIVMILVAGVFFFVQTLQD